MPIESVCKDRTVQICCGLSSLHCAIVAHEDSNDQVFNKIATHWEGTFQTNLWCPVTSLKFSPPTTPPPNPMYKAARSNSSSHSLIPPFAALTTLCHDYLKKNPPKIEHCCFVQVKRTFVQVKRTLGKFFWGKKKSFIILDSSIKQELSVQIFALYTNRNLN